MADIIMMMTMCLQKNDQADTAIMQTVQPAKIPNLLPDEYGGPLYVPPTAEVVDEDEEEADVDASDVGMLPVASPPRYHEPMSVKFPSEVRNAAFGPTFETEDLKPPK